MGESRGALSEGVHKAAEAYSAVRELYQEHAEQVHELHTSMMDEAVRRLASTGPYDEGALRLARLFVDDVALLFRFLRRGQFDTERTRTMLYKSLQWRLEADVDDLATDLLHSPYISTTSNNIPLFWLHSRFRDRLGRPCLYVRLQHVERAPEGLRDLKTNILASMDVVRRYLRHVNRRSTRGAPVLQSVLAVDVADAGLSNLELELLPFLVDLLKHHYPGLFGTVYVVHYGWLQSGLWRMLKPVLPPKLLARILFVDKEALKQHFDNALPKSLGGTLSVPIAPDTSDVFNYYARSAPWSKADASEGEPIPPALHIRQPDFDSIYDVMSRVGSPFASQPITPITPAASHPGTPRLRASASPQLADRTSPVHLPQAERAAAAAVAGASRRTRPRVPEGTVGASAAPSPNTARTRPPIMQWITDWIQPRTTGGADPDADIPRVDLPHPTSYAEPRHEGPTSGPDATAAAGAGVEHNAVTRYLSWRAHKYAEMDGHVSPYNIENPYFGYPAAYVDDGEPMDAASTTSVVNVTDASNPAGLSRQLRVRRRKRDLLRTLGYLFVLRLLNLYCQARRMAGVVYWVVLRRRGHERVVRALGRLLAHAIRDVRTGIGHLLFEVPLRSLLLAGLLMAFRFSLLPRIAQRRTRGGRVVASR